MRLLWILSLCLLPSCIEYRWEARNKIPEQYFRTPYTNSRKHQDPKIGSKTKLYLNNHGPARLYIGGHYSKNRLTGNLGVIYYLDERVSFEVGYRSLIRVLDDRYSDNSTRVDWHNDRSLENMFYLGGRINF